MPPRERQKLQPRPLGDYTGPAPYNPGRDLEDYTGPAPYNPDRNIPGTGYLLPNPQEPWNNPGQGSYWNVGLQSGDNSGIISAAMANHPRMQQVKSLYENFDPWIPNLDGDSLGYEWERPLLGGTLGYGFDYDMGDEGLGAFLNWKLGIGT